MTLRPLAALVLAACLCSGEWTLQSDTEGVARRELPPDALAQIAALRLEAERQGKADGDAWIELVIVAADGRRFASARPLALPDGERSGQGTIALEPGSWSGPDGPLGGDALRAVAALEMAVHGAPARVRLRVTAAPRSGRGSGFAIIASDEGLVDRGPWREWRIRLAGSADGERGELELADAQGRRWPMFLDQPGGPDAAGRWRARGPARWVLRLAAGEAPAAPARLRWSDGEARWEGPPVNLPVTVTASEALPPPAAGILPVPRASGWSGPVLAPQGETWVRGAAADPVEALAPVLAWRIGWTGFRGPEAISWPQAAAFDRELAAGCSRIDLLPQGLAEEQGAFRFGLAPWTGASAAWRHPRDLWSAEAPWQAWRAHARHVLARARAAPGLGGFAIGVAAPATGGEATERLRATAGDLARMVAELDGRPLRALHPQLTAYTRTDPKGAWYDFDAGTMGWSQGPPPLAGPARSVARPGGGKAIAAPVPPGDGVRVAGLQAPVDANLFNLDRMEVDVSLSGGGSAAVYAWVTDHHHRWWQQRIGDIDGDGGWQTLGVDAGDGAAWSGAPGLAWDGEIRRRIRAFGLVAYVRGGGQAGELRIDRLRRLGWPSVAAQPTLSLELRDAGPAQLKRWQPVAAIFTLSLAAQNPYDPDHADVIGEAEGPDGARIRHPAYWQEPYRLDFDGTTERALPDGAGSWRWRWTPPAPGAWRWRIVARIKHRDRWLDAASAWQAVEVSTTRGAMPTVAVDRSDPRWFADAEGRFWYPIGINLRSPGDERQDDLLAGERAFSGGDAKEPAAVRGWLSADWERRGTRIYERWFELMRRNRLDWARVWMSPWWCGLEWRRDWDDYGGLTWFSQANAARMDRVVELAAQHGVYLQVELMNHGMVGEHADRQWADSPYNIRLGGPVRRVGDWFRSDEVWAIHSKRIRYTLARWGWASHIAAWSLCSELEFTGTFDEETGRNDAGFSPGLQAWLERSVTWMRANDPQPGRPLTMHWSHPWAGPQHWRTPGFGFSNSNAYTAFQDFHPALGGVQRARRDLPLALDAYLNQLFPPETLGRPTLIGEWGGHWSDNTPWALRGELRTGLWLQAVMPYAGNTGFWWWLWLDQTDAWGLYAAVARFMEGEDRRGVAWRTVKPPLLGAEAQRYQAQGMASDRAVRLYVWPKGFDQDHRRVRAPADVQVRLEGLAPGAWRVRRFDAASGAQVSEDSVRADDQGFAIVRLPAIAPDAVLKLDRP